jgi:hypothetical protein
VLITVEFRRTGSGDFARALELASGHPTFASTPPPVRFRVRYTQDEADACEALLAIVGVWSQTRLLLGEHPVDRERLSHLLACYRSRLAAPDRRAYCQGGEVHETQVGPARQLFPCRLIPISEGNHQGWFHYGRLTREGVFLVDKGLLRQAVREAARRTLAEHCPAFFPAEVDGVVDRLPERIHPQRDGGWTVREGWVDGRFVPVGVEKRRREPVAGASSAARPAGRQGGPAGGPGRPWGDPAATADAARDGVSLSRPARSRRAADWPPGCRDAPAAAGCS